MRDYQKAIRFMSEMAFFCAAAVFIGNFIDIKLHTRPLFLLGLLAYAFIGSLVKLVKGFGDEDER